MESSTDVELLISERELAEEALAALSSDPFASDAVPFDDGRAHRNELLPAWYMPSLATASATRFQKVAAVACIGALLSVTGAGLCTTYGIPELPLW